MGRGQQTIRAAARRSSILQSSWRESFKEALKMDFQGVIDAEYDESIEDTSLAENSEPEPGDRNFYSFIDDPRITQPLRSDLVAWEMFSATFYPGQDITAITLNQKGKRDFWALERIVSRAQLSAKDFSLDIQTGYYADILEVHLIDETQKKIEEAFNDYHSQPNNMKAKVEWVLNYEYGSILESLKETRFSIGLVATAHLHFGERKHAQNLDSQTLENYQLRYQTSQINQFLRKQLPQGVVLSRPGRSCRVIDGYHRLSTAVQVGEQKALVVIAEP